MPKKQTKESFWSKVDVTSPDKCWEWQGSINSTGYGTVSWGGKVYTAHRVAAWLDCLVPTIAAPKDSNNKLHVLHKCDNRKCCNPNHFFFGSYSDNNKDAYSKHRNTQPRGEKHANAKLTNKQAKEIRKKYKAGESQTLLAKQYGVSQVSVSLIVRGKTYT